MPSLGLVSVRLTAEQAKRYAARLDRQGRWRVSLIPFGNGRSMIELREFAGLRGQTPAKTLRTAAECEELLALCEVTP